MGIPDEDVARVRAATDIVALIGEHAALKRQGRRWVGLCPFHGEKTPSFSVNADEGFYYCFGCQAKGDAISFVRAIEHLDFVDAVRRLADKAGHHHPRGRRHRAATASGARCSSTPWSGPPSGTTSACWSGADAGQARDYLRSRGYDGEVVRRFRLGWAPDAWDELCTGLGLSTEMAVGAGLGFVNRRGRLQDAFRARILFPICDPSGHPVALGGRVLPGSSDPAKYKNSIETPIYSKRRTLYALNWAKQDIIKSDEVVVCEGYTDVIGLFEAGVERAVATCGTALAEEHVKLLRGFASRVVLAFDADGAGQSAAGRFYEWERRFEIDVAVAALPPGSDPGEMARTDPDGAAGRHRGGQAVPPVPGGAHPRRRRALHARGPGPGGRHRLGRGGRASRQPGPGPVPDAGGRAVPARAARSCATGSSSSGGRDRGRLPAGERPRTAGPEAAGSRRATAGDRASRGSGSPRTAIGTPTASTAGGSPAGSARAGRTRASGGTVAGPSVSSGPGSRPCAWPSTGPRTSATGWRRPCSATTSSGRRSWCWPRPTRTPSSTRPSSRLRPRSGPSWCA